MGKIDSGIGGVVGLVGLGGALVLSGCSSEMLRSTKFPQNNDGAAYGVPYYLPKMILPVTVSYGPPAAAPSKSEKPDAKGAADSTKDKPDGGESKKEGTKDQKDQKDAAAGAPQLALSIKIGAPKYYADPSETLFLEYNESGNTDDVFALRVGPDGLLQTTDVKSKDRTADVFLKVVELVGQAAKLAKTALLPAMEEVPPEKQPDCSKWLGTSEFEIDPTVAATPTHFTGLSVMSTPVTSTSVVPAIPDPEVNEKEQTGVVFRPVKPYRVQVSFTPTSEQAACGFPSQYFSEFTVTAPDTTRTFRVDVSRAALVEKKVKLIVENGLLTGTDVDKPSQVLAGISLPVDIVKALVAIPSELLHFKIEQIKDENQLSAEQANQLKAQIELLKLQQELNQAQQEAPAIP